MNPDTLTYRLLPAAEQHRVLALLGRCFPAYWEQLALQEASFPFDEMSLVAEDNGEIAGHVGLLFFTVSGGDGNFYDQAGIASVAVAPEYRGRGIADTLCRMAAEWAQREQHFASLPLFTGLDRVYLKSGWRNYRNFAPRRVQLPASSPVSFRKGPELNAGEREAIRQFYLAGEDFPGKVRRGDVTEFHAWPRLFAEPEFEFFVNDTGYILVIEGAVAEAFWTPEADDTAIVRLVSHAAEADGALTVAMPESSRIWGALRQAGAAIEVASDDRMHGEHAMLFDFSDPGWNRIIATEALYFPLADKF